MQQRLQKNPYLEFFDGPDGNTPVEERDESITATQALYFMNSEFAHEESGLLATRILDLENSAAKRVEHAYKQIFSRPPSQSERERGNAYFAKVESELGQTKRSAWSGYLRGMISSNEFLFID